MDIKYLFKIKLLMYLTYTFDIVIILLYSDVISISVCLYLNIFFLILCVKIEQSSLKPIIF